MQNLLLMDVQQLAHYLNLKPSKIRAMVFRREIPYLKIGRLVRFQKDMIDHWINERSQSFSPLKK